MRGRKPLPGPRWPGGRRVRRGEFCACGNRKGRYSVCCLTCKKVIGPRLRNRRFASAPVFVCACGNRISRNAIRCLVCAQAARAARREGMQRHCEVCGVMFYRKKGRHDARRFCSRFCAFRARTRHAAERAETRDHKHAIQREFVTIMRQQLRTALRTVIRTPNVRRCLCGAQLQHRARNAYDLGRTQCQTCASAAVRAAAAAAWSVARALGVPHICPNCGGTFQGRESVTYCSNRCARQLHHKGRYPQIASLPLQARNHVAELISLMRAANRRLHNHSSA